MAKCQQCELEFFSKSPRSLYCSGRCKVAAHRAKLHELKPHSLCWFCGTEFKIKDRTKFCCDKHKQKFYKNKELNKPIVLTIDSKTKIETRKYDKIPEVLQQWKERRKDFLALDSVL